MASKKRGLDDPNRTMETRDPKKRYAAYNVQPRRPKRGKPKPSSGKPLQVSPVGSSETQGWSRNKPKNIPQGYGLQTALTYPPKYRLVKAKPLDMKKGVKRAASQMGAKPKMMGRRRGK